MISTAVAIRDSPEMNWKCKNETTKKTRKREKENKRNETDLRLVGLQQSEGEKKNQNQNGEIKYGKCYFYTWVSLTAIKIIEMMIAVDQRTVFSAVRRNHDCANVRFTARQATKREP